jgi:hypothetical protein
MTSRKSHQADATRHAVAIGQWDDEGGASMSPRSYTGGEVSNDVSSKRRLVGDERFEHARVPHYKKKSHRHDRRQDEKPQNSPSRPNGDRTQKP